MERFSTKIKDLRKNLGLSLDAVAKLSGLAKSYIWEIEANKTRCGSPSLDTVFRLSHALNVSPSALLNPLYEDWKEHTSHMRQTIIIKEKVSKEVILK